MRLGNSAIDPPALLAPTAGLADRPPGALVERWGGGPAVREMPAQAPGAAAPRPRLIRRDVPRRPMAVIAGPGPLGAGAPPARRSDRMAA
jgi:hypothetical protein